jgi:hypothetical protein
VGYLAGNSAQGSNSVAIGTQAGQTNQSANATAVGNSAGFTNQGVNAVAVGIGAGATNQSTSATAVGVNAGNSSQGQSAVAIGNGAGQVSQGTDAAALGNSAGFSSQGSQAIALGTIAGYDRQAANSVAIGYAAGQTLQGSGSIAIGFGAGNSSMPNGSICINAIGAVFNPHVTSTSACFIRSLRARAATTAVYYDTTTFELHYLTSSRDTKSSIETLSSNTSMVYALEPRTYLYKSDMGAGFQCGYIAEEVAEVEPGFATYNSVDGPPVAINYNTIQIYMLEEMKKLRTDNMALHDANVILGQRLSTLEGAAPNGV